MIDWPKLQPLYERKAYRIVQKHVKAILQGIPINNVSQRTWEYVIQANITEEQIKKMFIDLYSPLVINYGNRVNNELEKTKKANVLFNEYLLEQILLFLSNEGGAKITSVHGTLIEEVIKAVKLQLGENATVIEIQKAIFNVVSKSQVFYKWQALRIARTETTFSAGFAAMKTAEQSNLVLDKVWISAQDNRTRVTPFDHLDMNNQVQELEKPFFVGGENIMYPGDPKASPGNVINCRCTIAFRLKRDINGDLIMKR